MHWRRAHPACDVAPRLLPSDQAAPHKEARYFAVLVANTLDASRAPFSERLRFQAQGVSRPIEQSELLLVATCGAALRRELRFMERWRQGIDGGVCNWIALRSPAY